jgi:hypothetical protein
MKLSKRKKEVKKIKKKKLKRSDWGLIILP